MSDQDNHIDQERQDERDDETPDSGAGATGLPKNWLVPVVLLLLRDLSSYGYDLMKGLASFGFAMLNPGPLYRILRQMEKDGLVRSWWDTSRRGPARRVYSITELGEAHLKLWANSLDQHRKAMDRLFRLYTGRSDDK